MDGRAEVETDHLTAGGALNARIFSGQTIAGGQAALVQFEDEIAAAILVGDCRTGNVETPMFVCGGDQTARCYHANTGKAFFPRVLLSVQVAVVEHLADDIGAIKVRIGNDPHGGRRFPGDISTDDVVEY